MREERINPEESSAADRDGYGWEQTRAVLRSSKHQWLQRLFGLQLFYVITILHVLVAGTMLLSAHLNILPLWVALACSAVLGIADLILFVIFKTEYNLRFKDPTLLAPRTVLIVVVMLFAQIYAGPTKSACSLALITGFVLASSHASLRTMLRLNGLTIVAYAATLPLMHQVEGAHYNGGAEFLNWMSFASCLTSAVLAGATISGLRKQLTESNIKLGDSLDTVTALATTDELTQVPNRRYVVDMMKHETSRLERGGAGFSVCLMDIDHFKSINDNYGHPCGDAVLKAFASLADTTKRGGDIFARWGGEEFILFLPQSSLGTARVLAERVRSLVRTLQIAELPADRKVTVSIGIAEIAPQESLKTVLERADQALYRAKQAGRDRVESVSPTLVACKEPEIQRAAS